MAAEFYIHDGTAQRKAKEIYIHDGTAQRKAKQVWIHDGTAQRLVFSEPVGLVTGFTLDSYAQRTAASGVVVLNTRLNPDGTITTTTSGADYVVPVAAGSKWHAAAPLAGVGAGYYVRFSDTPGTWSAWISLSSALTYTVGATSAEQYHEELVTFELSSSSVGPAEATGTLVTIAEFG